VAVALFLVLQAHQGLAVVEGAANKTQMLVALQALLVKEMLVVQAHNQVFFTTLVVAVARVQLEALQAGLLQ
jgi:hypothetical protein